jgi:aminoglycoside phosphotransferase (APT) family kinase protein
VADIAFQPPPGRAALARLCEVLLPGSRLRRIRRLAGGISSGMHVMEVDAPSGERHGFVLRRYSDWWVARDPLVSQREFSVLQALVETHVPAPRPLWLDAEGVLLGRPAMVMTRLPGRGNLEPRNLEDWIRQLAASLAAIHDVRVDRGPLALLEDRDAGRHTRLELGLAEQMPGHPSAPALLEAMRALWPGVQPTPRVLLHGDFWPGNTLWHRGRLTGVVDWEQAARGSREADTVYCHMDMTLTFGREVADRFLAAYEDASGWRVHDRAFWALQAAWRALPNPGLEWLPAGWAALGLADLTPECVNSRYDAYIAESLRAAGA